MPLLAGPETGVPAIDDPAFCEILQLLHERTGTDFASYKLPTVARRTLNRMISVGAETFADYLQLLRQREGEAARNTSRSKSAGSTVMRRRSTCCARRCFRNSRGKRTAERSTSGASDAAVAKNRTPSQCCSRKPV